MAPKPSHNMLIHCQSCGEDYSATYRRCPFCGARNDPRRVPNRETVPPASVGGEDELDDGYIFDGQSAFEEEPEEEYYAPRPKGGKRLAPKQSGRGMDLPPINWPRLITFLCSLVIIVAALVIVFTVIYPQLRGDPKPGESQTVTPSGEPSAPVVPPSEAPSQPVVPPSDPPVDPTPAQPVLTSIALDTYDFTIYVGQSHQMKVTTSPADYTGPFTWTAAPEGYITVSETGNVTNVNTSGTFHNVYLTVEAGGISTQCIVRVPATSGSGTNPPASNPPASDPPVISTTPPSGGGTVTVGRAGTIVGADGGLRVRPDPSTSNPPIATLLNGNTVQVVADAGGGWYQISFTGSGGATMYGYIMGEYISTP